MSALTLPPHPRACGTIQLPGSKSLANRLLLLAALSEGETELVGLPASDDVRHLSQALAQLGRPFTSGRFFLGNAGTAFRPLTAILSASPGDFTLEGDPRMHERPIGPLVDALRRWGAEIEYLGQPGYPPLRIHGRCLAGGPTVVDATLSSQYVSALLMAAPLLERGASIHLEGELVSQPYIEMTCGQMRQFGIEVVRRSEREYQVPPAAYRTPGRVLVEGDATAASYFLAAGAIGQGPVRVVGAGRDSVQGEIRFAEVLQSMGAEIEWGPDWVQARGPASGRLRGLSWDLNAIPDSAMTLAMVALFAEGASEIRGVDNWRVKECDRQQALFQELSKVGARVEMLPDGLRVAPPTSWQPACIETYRDHRMAMCFSLATFSPVGITILEPECVSKTYPGYFEEFAKLLC